MLYSSGTSNDIKGWGKLGLGFFLWIVDFNFSGFHT